MKVQNRVRATLALFGIAAFGFVTFAAACGHNVTAECQTVCTNQNKCTGATQQNCPSYCANVQTAVDASGCGSAYDDAANCYEGVKDVCTDHSCDNKTSALVACLFVYCLQHANDPACKSFSAGG